VKIKSLCIAVSTSLALMGGASVAMAQNSMEKAKDATENAVDKTIDKLPPKRTMSRAEYSSEKDQIENEYKSAKANCASMTGNAKSVCHVEAKSDEKSKLADLEAKYKGTASADTNARVEKVKAQYEVAKQKCEDQTGADRSSCKASAKAERDKGVADAKAAAKTASAS